jgi:hypothetical protein
MTEIYARGWGFARETGEVRVDPMQGAEEECGMRDFDPMQNAEEECGMRGGGMRRESR